MKLIAATAAALALSIGLAGTASAETPNADRSKGIVKKRYVKNGVCTYIVQDEHGREHHMGWYCGKRQSGN